mmetsp:Transcript_19466/g.32504  ORF Transcript_19466/g.32504 Transcript_19466/m.32504 type:complete len:409 (+) Transcript_19466:145-1371(+)|eukprot:CAMPEP_0119306126 /NCGR_PEP_ID=MMETSP1333-20130426/6954_1 /TAXON_ID=418940 /ORGANISM="Scyphosphaera apsteinii, Strain RCC1455" /LENGTH=408 /DNA_ID=CAMNT_0007309359 /DNA_START=149 /DNA_END=1375 /DNA_ORIENTATION=-
MTAGQCIQVSNDHGDALHKWLAVARLKASLPLAVLHVDAHNDLDVPAGGSKAWRHKLLWKHNATLRQEMVSSVDLASFQIGAVHAGIVDRIIWVRQGESPCTHSVMNLSYNPVASTFEDSVLLSNTEYDAASEHDAWTSGSYAFHEIPEGMLGVPAVARTVRHLLDRTYILDVDLDFFVHSAAKPSRLGVSWALASSTFPSDCTELLLSCRRWSDARCTLWRDLDAVSSDHSPRDMETDNSGEGSDRDAHSSGEAAEVQQWRSCIHAFEEWQRPFPPMPGLHAAERSIVADQMHQPTPLLDPGEIARSIVRLEMLLRTLSSPPAAITIARSIDGFTRIFDVAALETEVISMVTRVWYGARTPCVSYSAGTAPLEALQWLHSIDFSASRLRMSDRALHSLDALQGLHVP